MRELENHQKDFFAELWYLIKDIERRFADSRGEKTVRTDLGMKTNTHKERLRSSWLGRWISMALFLASVGSCQAVLFVSTADPEHNTKAPTGDLANSGWALEGLWGGFLGTAIAPNLFITAAHVGGQIGDPFIFNGQTFTTTAFFDDPNSDLRIWKVNGSFSQFAALYSASDEVGKELVVIGRGTPRGEAIMSGGLLGGELKGWKWGVYDGRQRWGRNQVSSIVDNSGAVVNMMGTGPNSAQLLRVAFDRNGLPDEADLSLGDSGGAMFMLEAGAWKLAGINFAVDGPYNDSASGPGFDASVLDEGGLYKQDSAGAWVLTPDLPGDSPGAFYATRISSRQAWVQSIIAANPPPPPGGPVVQSAAAVTGPYADAANAIVDPNAKTITLPRSQRSAFYRLSAGSQLRVTGIRITDVNVVISYQ